MNGVGSHPIVVFGDDWARHVSSMQHLFREIVSHRNVIWVNGIGHRIPTLSVADFRRAWEKGRAMLRRPAAPDGNGLDGRAPSVVVQPRVLPWHNRSAVCAFNAWSLGRSVREALRRAGTASAPILVTGSPPSAPLVGRLGEAASVYFCMDDFSHLAGVNPHMLHAFEQKLLESVDAVVATAKALTQLKVPRSGEVHYLPQGVNYEHFATPRPEPPEFRGLPRPLIGFAGGVSSCCDFELIRRIAQAYPHGSLALVGPVTVDAAEVDLPNIHVMGPRPYLDLPAYVQRFDVGLIPYILNDWTRSVDPLKLLEYLAAGIPVVTTAIPEVMKYSHAVRIAGDHDAFLREVSSALTADGGQERERGQDLARQNTWADRASRLLEILDGIVERRALRVGGITPARWRSPCTSFP